VRLRLRGRALGGRGDRDLAEGPADPRRGGFRLHRDRLTAGPEIHARGSGIDDAAFAEVRPRIDEALAKAATEGINDAYQLGQLVRRTVGRWVNENYRRRPMIIPVVIEV
jgi:mRNA degradation ribonuclease J1/J2